MILGQSAATAACMAIDGNIDVQDVPYARLRERLLADKQVLDIPTGSTSEGGIDPKSLPGIVIDNAQAKVSEGWSTSSSVGGYVGSEYLHDGHEGLGERTVTYSLKKVPAGDYEIRISYTPQANRATNVPVTITVGGQSFTKKINQRQTPDQKPFASLGKFHVTGNAAEVVIIGNAGADGHVIADAIQLQPAK